MDGLRKNEFLNKNCAGTPRFKQWVCSRHRFSFVKEGKNLIRFSFKQNITNKRVMDKYRVFSYGYWEITIPEASGGVFD